MSCFSFSVIMNVVGVVSCRKVSFGSVSFREIPPFEDRQGFWAIDSIRFKLRVEKIEHLLACSRRKRFEKLNN